MKTQAIIAAAGIGQRLGQKVPKPLVFLAGKPLFVYAARVLEKSSLIDSIIIVVHKKYRSEFKKVCGRYQLKKIRAIIPGGSTRCHSVANGLKALDADTELVLIQDAARPLLDGKMVERAIRACRNVGGVIVAVPVKPTIKRVTGRQGWVKETLPRDDLWEVQTPQVFPKAIINLAHQTAKTKDATDDACLVEKIGKRVKVVMGDYRNIKITTRDDLVIAEKLLVTT